LAGHQRAIARLIRASTNITNVTWKNSEIAVECPEYQISSDCTTQRERIGINAQDMPMARKVTSRGWGAWPVGIGVGSVNTTSSRAA